MNLNALVYFRILGRLEHYGKAAQEINIAQPALSRAINQLENDLGTKLFEREGRNIQLTKWGREYWLEVNEALSALEKAEKNLHKRTRNQIDLGYSFSLGVSFAPELIKEFMAVPGNEHIEFYPLQGNSDELIDYLKKDKCDLALVLRTDNSGDIEYIPVHRQEIVVIVSKDHPLAQKDSIEICEVLDYPFIYFNKQISFRKYVDSFFEEYGVKPKIAYELEEDNSIAGMVAANMGIAIVAYEQHLTAFNIKILPITNRVYERYFYLALMKNRVRSKAVDSFINFIIKNKRLEIDLTEPL